MSHFRCHAPSEEGGGRQYQLGVSFDPPEMLKGDSTGVQVVLNGLLWGLEFGYSRPLDDAGNAVGNGTLSLSIDFGPNAASPLGGELSDSTGSYVPIFSTNPSVQTLERALTED